MWRALRQGARNVAGVRWQVAVSVHLLVAGRAGALPFASITPEGFEDADFRHVDGTATFAQMKELGAGAGQAGSAGNDGVKIGVAGGQAGQRQLLSQE